MPSDSNHRVTIFVPEGIGLAAGLKKVGKALDGVSFVRLTKKGSLNEGNLLLELSMRQIMEIHDSLKKLDDARAHRNLLIDVQSQYENLLIVLRRLQLEAKKTNFLEFSKKKKIRLDTQELCEEGYRLYEVTKSTSDDLRRAVIAYNIGKLDEVEEPLENEQVTGISVRLDGPMDEETASLIAETASFCTALEDLIDDETPSNDSDAETEGTTIVTRASVNSDDANIGSPSSPPTTTEPTPAGDPITSLVANPAECNVNHASASSSHQNKASEPVATGPVISSNDVARPPPPVVNIHASTLPAPGAGLNLPCIPAVSSPSSPGSPYIVVHQNIYNGPHTTYNNNMQNTNTQGATMIAGGGDGHSGAINNMLPPPNPPS